MAAKYTLLAPDTAGVTLCPLPVLPRCTSGRGRVSHNPSPPDPAVDDLRTAETGARAPTGTEAGDSTLSLSNSAAKLNRWLFAPLPPAMSQLFMIMWSVNDFVKPVPCAKPETTVLCCCTRYAVPFVLSLSLNLFTFIDPVLNVDLTQDFAAVGFLLACIPHSCSSTEVLFAAALWLKVRSNCIHWHCLCSVWDWCYLPLSVTLPA